MGFMIDGRDIATTATGFLENVEDWSTEIADLIANHAQG